MIFALHRSRETPFEAAASGIRVICAITEDSDRGHGEGQSGSGLPERC